MGRTVKQEQARRRKRPWARTGSQIEHQDPLFKPVRGQSLKTEARPRVHTLGGLVLRINPSDYLDGIQAFFQSTRTCDFKRLVSNGTALTTVTNIDRISWDATALPDQRAAGQEQYM